MHGLTLPETLRLRSVTHGDKPYLSMSDGGVETFAEVYHHSCCAAADMAHQGVKAGDRVLIMAANSLEAIHAWFGANLLGATEVWINPALRGRPLQHAVAVSKARVLVTDQWNEVIAQGIHGTEVITVLLIGQQPPGDVEAVHRIARFDDRSGADTVVLPDSYDHRSTGSIVFTSGTTGPAKGVLMPHRQLRLIADTSAHGVRMTDADIFYCIHPMHHTAGKFMVVFAAMTVGAHVVLERQFDPVQWLDNIRRHNATIGFGHGPMLEMIHNTPERSDDADNPVSRIMAAPMPKKIALDFERRFDLKAVELWGMTEVCLPTWRPLDEPLRPGSCGKVLTEYFDLRIADPDTDEPVPAGEVGELQVRPLLPFTMMQGYEGQPERTLTAWRNFFFHTGDLGWMDCDGYVYFTDRVGDRIRRRAENISTYDIESAIYEIEAVAECAAVAVASDFDGDDDIKVCIVAAPGAQVDPVDVIRHCADSLPHHMVPRYIELLEQLPRTITKKVIKAALRESGTAGAWDRRTAGIELRSLYTTAPTVGSKEGSRT